MTSINFMLENCTIQLQGENAEKYFVLNKIIILCWATFLANFGRMSRACLLDLDKAVLEDVWRKTHS